MKVKIRKNYILIVSRRLVHFCGILNGIPERIRAASLFPFIFVRSEEETVPWLINHERIHFRQQLEMLFIGSFLLDLFETLYARFVLKKSSFESYLWHSSEQEAYRNQHDKDYLTKRKLWSQLKYVKDKRPFKLGEPGEIIFT